MMASQDKRKGASHLEQLVIRHPEIGEDDPVTLELLAKYSKVHLSDMIEIYNKKSDKDYELAPTGLDVLCQAIHRMEKEEIGIVEAKVIDAVVHCTLPMPSKPPPLIRQKGYFQPAPNPVHAPAPASPPPLPPRPRPVKAPEQKKDTRVFDEDALVKVYEYVNRCERWMRKEIKTQPTPKSLSNKYKDYIKK
jgi:hypothetical protein